MVREKAENAEVGETPHSAELDKSPLMAHHKYASISSLLELCFVDLLLACQNKHFGIP